MSDTPRTDSLGVGKWLVGDTNVEMVRSDFARELERELAAAREATLDECWQAINKWVKCGPLQDDQRERRNGLILASNLVIALKNAAPQVAAVDAISGESAQAGDHASSSTASPAVAAPYVRAAFINAISEEGTKAEAVEYLQKEWNENCELRRACKESLDYVRRMEGSLSAPAHPLYQVLKALI